MATLVRFSDGTSFKTYSKEENDYCWEQIQKETWNSKTAFFTPYDKLKYFILEEKEVSHNKFQTIIKTNNKLITVKHKDVNQDEKIMAAVRKEHNK